MSEIIVIDKKKLRVGSQDASQLMKEDDIKTLELVNLIEEKRTGTIQCRTWIKISMQIFFLKRWDIISALVVCLEDLKGTMAICIKAGRDIGVLIF